MSTDDPSDFIRPPNDGAYESKELRTGPPLDYVAEKCRHNLEALHRLIADIQNEVPEDLSVEQPSPKPSASLRDDILLPSAQYAFQSGIVGYLALKNLLAVSNDDDFPQRLFSFSREEFNDWLDRIDQGGSVTG